MSTVTSTVISSVIGTVIPDICTAPDLAPLLARHEGEDIFGFAFDHDHLRYWIAGLRFGPKHSVQSETLLGTLAATYFAELFLCVRPLDVLGKRYGSWWRLKGGQDAHWVGILPVIADETVAILGTIKSLSYPAQRFDHQGERLDAA
jgi:hypothetical protein